MIVGSGTDVCDFRRIRSSIEWLGDRFALKLLAEGEI